MEELFLAALNNDTAKIREYLKFGDVNITDKYHSSLLHYAARGNAIEVSNLLLDNYINLNIVDDKGETPLFIAISRGELGMCKVLCRYNAFINIVNKSNETPYFKAIMKGRMDILELLEDTLNIDYEFVNYNKENALFYALKAYNNPLFFRIVESHPKLLLQRNFNNESLLMLAIKLDNSEVVDYLLNTFTNLYESDCSNNNVLFYAAKYASCDIMKKLLNTNPIIEGKNKDNEDIFTLAAQNPHPTTILLENYKDTYEYKLYKRTYPFHVGVIERNYDLLEYGMPDINKKDAKGISLKDYMNFIDDEIIFNIFKLKR